MQLPRANPTIIFKELSDGAVLFSPTTEIYFGLNDVGARIWQLLPPASESFDQLCSQVADAYPDVARETIRQDAQELLAALVAKGLAIDTAEPAHETRAGAAQTS